MTDDLDDSGGLKKRRRNLLGVSILLIVVMLNYTTLTKTGVTLFLVNLSVSVKSFVVLALLFSVYYCLRYLHLFTEIVDDEGNGTTRAGRLWSTTQQLVHSNLVNKLYAELLEVCNFRIGQIVGSEAMTTVLPKAMERHISQLALGIKSKAVKYTFNVHYKFKGTDDGGHVPIQFDYRDISPKRIGLRKTYLILYFLLVKRFRDSLEYWFPFLLYIVALLVVVKHVALTKMLKSFINWL